MNEHQRQVVVGRRRCTKCRYSLTGQPIAHDEDYDLRYVRCTECGGVASIQEHPMIGPWSLLCTNLLTVGWTLAIVAASLGCAGSLMLFSMGTTQVATEEYSGVIMNRYREIETVGPLVLPGALPPGTPVAVTNALGTVRRTQISFGEWWIAADRAAILRDAGGWIAALNPHAFWMWLILVPLAVAWGAFWSVVFLQRRWPGRLVQVLMLGGLAAAFGAPLLFLNVEDVSWAHDAATQQIGTPVMAASIGVAMLGLAAGMAFGRPLARLAVRLTIPRRYHPTLAALWLIDGRTLPA